MITIAAVQLTSSDQIDSNAQAISAFVAEAAAQGVALVALPENAYFMRREAHSEEPAATQTGFTMTNHPAIQHAAGLARQHGLWLLVGSVTVSDTDHQKKPFNRSLLFSPDGVLAAHYDKRHLFDVTLPDGQVYKESARVQSGQGITVAKLPWGGLGLSICYDLRFAEHYRALTLGGADVLAVPSAFTVPTGKAHWEVLLRARAIENGAYVIAPAQVGTHAGGRTTYGHSMIVDPWGKVLCMREDGQGILTATINVKTVQETRARLGIPLF